jgi:cytochrome c oxidase subunit IV
LIPLYLFIFILTFLHSGWYPREVNELNAILLLSIPALTVLYYLANIIWFSLSPSTFENQKIIGKTRFILQILDSKNKQYFFKGINDNRNCIIDLLDFFEYHLCSVDSESIHIEPKNEKSDLQTNYFFKFQFSFKSYGLEHFQSYTFGFLFYCLIFSFCFSETYLISDPWVRFPVYAIIIPFIICMYLLLVLVRGVYEKIKRKTFFNTGGGLALQLNFLKGYEGDHSNFRPLKSTDPNSDKTMIQFNLNNWPHRFISEFNGDILFIKLHFTLTSSEK